MKDIHIFFILILSVVATSSEVKARELSTNDIGKIYSRMSTAPINRQGSCLVFKYLQDVYCLSSIHVTYYPDSAEGFKQTVKFENGQESTLSWVSADWSFGLVVLRLNNPPMREYLTWAEVPFAKDAVEVSAWGFPVGSDSLNQTYGKIDPKVAINLYVFNAGLISAEDISSEVGFSGGALVNEKNEYLGLLSHQIYQNEKLYTVAIGTEDIKRWVTKVVLSEDTYPYIFSPNINLADIRNQKMLETSGFTISNLFNDPRVYAYYINVHGSENRLRQHPPFVKFKKLLTDGDTRQEGYYFLGGSPMWPMTSLEEVTFFPDLVKFFQYLNNAYRYSDEAFFLHFMKTATQGYSLNDANLDFRRSWMKHKEIVEANISKDAPVWFEKYKRVVGFLFSERQDMRAVTNQAEAAMLKYAEFEALLLKNAPAKEQSILMSKYSPIILELENRVQEILRCHKFSVKVISATDLMK